MLVLASASPRRRDLLTAAGVAFEVRPADIDESVRPGEPPRAYVERLAREKAAAVAGPVVLAADTTVDLDGEILGKPVDVADAVGMLRRLRGRTHQVHTGVAVRRGDDVRAVVVSTTVRFLDVDDDAIERYVATGEPMDKAGAYAIQGGAGAFVASTEGSATGIIGLPMEETLALLHEAGVGPGAPQP